MSQAEKMNQRLGEIRKRLALSLAVNGLVPLALYVLVHPLFANDAIALAIAGTVPAIRTLVVWVIRRRIDWIGALAVLGFALAFAVSALLNGNALLLKVHGSLLTGTIGLVLLVSAVIGRPLLFPLMQVFARNNPELSNAPGKRANNTESSKRITLVTALIGLVLLVDAIAHIILALTLPTSTFLALSRVTNWVVLGGGLAIVWLTRQRVGGSEGLVGEMKE